MPRLTDKNDLRPAVTTRGERVAATDEKTAKLAASAAAYSEYAVAFRDSARKNYERKWSLFSCCSGPAVLEQVAEARPAAEAVATTAPSRDLRAAAAYSSDRQRIPAIPTVDLTKGEVDAICTSMGEMISKYDPGRNLDRQKQLTTFEAILFTYAEKTKRSSDSVQLPKNTYDKLRNDLAALLTAVSEDHLKNGGLSVGGLKIGNQKSTLQQKLEACLDLLPEDGRAPRAALAARR